MVRSLLPWSVMLLGLWLPAQQAQQPDPTRRQFTVPLHDGSLQLLELLQGLLTAYELDGTGLDLPAARIDLTGVKGPLLLYGSRKLLLDTARFRRDLAAQQLLVSIDRERTREVRRRLRARLATFAARLAGTDAADRAYVLALPPELDPGRPLAVLVHGVDSDAEEFADLQAYLDSPPRCCQTATFTYPNDEAIDRVAAALSKRLRGLGSQPVVIIGHSMGGLVARAVVEDPALDPGNVRMLVLIGTPNAGSNLAGFRVALEARDVLRQADAAPDFARELLDAVIDHWRDGLGEAGGDLFPGSVFLSRMAARPRNADVAYHLVLGTRSLLRPAQLAAVQQEVQRRLGAGKLAQLLRPRLERWLADLGELVDGEGDGAVSVARGRLDGVEAVLLPLDHVGLIRLRGLLGRIDQPEEHPVFARIGEWLDPAPPAWLQGRVVDVLGEPVPAAEVWFARQEDIVRRTVADGEGYYLLQLPRGEGDLRLHAAAPRLTMASLPCSGAGLQNLTLVDAVALTGAVRGDDGAPIAGAWVAVASPTGFASLLRTDAGGRFACARAPIGLLRLRAWDAGRATELPVHARSDCAVSLQLRGAPLPPRLLAVPDFPAELQHRAYISVAAAGVPLPAAARRLPLRSDGAVSLPVLPFPHELALVAPGYAVHPEAVRCAAGARDDLEFRIAPLPEAITVRTAVRGRLIDAAGRGLGGFLVVCRDRLGERVGVTTTTADGGFTLHLPLPAEAHCVYGVRVGERLLGGSGDAAGFDWIQGAATADAPVELRLRPCGAIAGIAKAPNGAAMACAEVTLSLLRTNMLGMAISNQTLTATDRQGRVYLRGLADGRYRVRVRGLCGIVVETELSVQAGASTPLGAMQVVPTGAIAGRLLDDHGEPLAGAGVRFAPRPQQEGMQEGRAVSDREGRFVVRGLLPGEYRLAVREMPRLQATVAVRAGATTLVEPQPGR